MIETTILGVAAIAGAGVTFYRLVVGGRTQRIDLLGWIGATILLVAGMVWLTGVLVVGGIADDAIVFLATLTGCASLVGGVVYYMKHRPATFDTEPMEQAQTPRQTNYVTPGQYAAEAPAMRKRGRF